MNTDDSITCYHSNVSGNVASLTNTVGDIVTKYAYSPYGKVLADTTPVENPYKFAGSVGIMEELPGLYFMRARYYLSDTMSFLSTDPLKNIGPGWRPSRYLYVDGNPLKGIDPDGEIAVCTVILITISVYYVADATAGALAELRDGTGDGTAGVKLANLGLTFLSKSTPGVSVVTGTIQNAVLAAEAFSKGDSTRGWRNLAGYDGFYNFLHPKENTDDGGTNAGERFSPYVLGNSSSPNQKQSMDPTAAYSHASDTNENNSSRDRERTGRDRMNAMNPGKNIRYASNSKYSQAMKTKAGRHRAMNRHLDKTNARRAKRRAGLAKRTLVKKIGQGGIYRRRK